MNEFNAKLFHLGSSLSIPRNKIFTSLAADYLIELIAQQVVTNKKSRVVPRARKNLSMVTQLSEDNPQIEIWIKTIYRNMLYSYLEYFRGLMGKMDKMIKSVDVDRQALQRIYQILSSGSGVVLAGAHTCGYDHCIHTLKEYLPSIQILSKAKPTGGTRLMYHLRKLNNIAITPLSVTTLRKAMNRLKSGGIVAVAIDMPVKNGDKFRFFNQYTTLTNAHTRLAVHSGAKLVLVYTRRTNSDRYRLEFQEVRQPKKFLHKKDLITSWAQKSYQQFERFLVRWPEAWYGSTFDLFPQE